MGALVTFRDVTLGYDRHPAVHHLNGAVEAGALLAVIDRRHRLLPRPRGS